MTDTAQAGGDASAAGTVPAQDTPASDREVTSTVAETLASEAAPQKTVFRFYCEDQGCGMSEETLQRVGMAFTQCEEPSRTQYQGAGLFPVGRLDKDTTGLLLITNDGTWAHGITSPKKHTDKIYDAVVEGDIPEDVGDRFASGIVLDDGLHCLPAQAVQTGPRSLTVVVQEGKFHQVKRMCAAVGLKVVQLHRRSIGSVVLDDGLEPGQFRPLTDEEREALRSQSR